MMPDPRTLATLRRRLAAAEIKSQRALARWSTAAEARDRLVAELASMEAEMEGHAQP